MKTSVKLGRPAAFDKDAALEVAMRLFWERGYEGTSMADLSLAMGVHPSSIYAAFGDKQALFALTAKRYADVPAQYMTGHSNSPRFVASSSRHSTIRWSFSARKSIIQAVSR
jgi:AcrR family transcriptional regulator